MPYAQAAAWLGIPADHPFGLGTLPYGSFTTADRPGEQRVGVAIGDHVLDLSAATARLLPGRADLFGTGLLDAFLAAGDGAWVQVRADIVSWLSSDAYRVAVEDLLVTAAAVTMHLPFTVADYVDFYASEQHASNVGRIFRPFFFASRRRHTRSTRDWSSDVCSSDLATSDVVPAGSSPAMGNPPPAG